MFPRRIRCSRRMSRGLVSYSARIAFAHCVCADGGRRAARGRVVRAGLGKCRLTSIYSSRHGFEMDALLVQGGLCISRGCARKRRLCTSGGYHSTVERMRTCVVGSGAQWYRDISARRLSQNAGGTLSEIAIVGIVEVSLMALGYPTKRSYLTKSLGRRRICNQHKPHPMATTSETM